MSSVQPAGRSPLPWLAGVTVAGLVVRAVPIAVSDFPVNDGGMFVAVVRAIQDGGWWLPATVSWNGSDLPFIYPPLGFYVAGLIQAVLGVDIFAVFRWVPLFASTLLVPAVYFLGRDVLRSEIGGLVAALAYALTPFSYVWLIQGGGVTRAPGLLLGVLTVWQVVLLIREPGRRRALVVGLLAGVTALVHPGAALFVGVSAVPIWIFEGRTQRSLAWAAAAVGASVVIVAPWVLTVIAQHGLASLTGVPSNGPDSGATVIALVAGRFTGVPFTDPLSVLGFALAVLCLARRRFLLPLWCVAATSVSYQYAMIPFGLLIGVVGVDLDAMRRTAASSEIAGLSRRAPAVGLVLLAACLLLEGVASAVTFLNPGAPVHALSSDRRDAMAWVASELEPGARVAIVTVREWSGDPDSEWFPLLAQRRSVATVQGSEWLGREAFIRQLEAHRALQSCVRPASVVCVYEWLADRPADYLYLPAGQLYGPSSPADCCADLRAALRANQAFTPIYDGPGATIFRVIRQATPVGHQPP